MPSEIILIAAVTLDGFIARHSSEVTKWTKDLPLFKEQTMGHPVIMGSNTFHTLSNELVGREVVVVHRNDDPREILKNIKIVSINEAKSILEYTLTKPVISLNITESDILESQKTLQLENNIKENITH